MTSSMDQYSNFIQKVTELNHWSPQQEQILLEPYDYLLSTPGKEIRTSLIDAFNVWLQVPPQKLDIVKDLVRKLHTASLLMDDVEDNSELRRGNPVAHKVYGVPQTLNSANYVYFLAFQVISQFELDSKSISIHQTITDELINLHRGQGMDLYWRENLVCPTEKEYLQMVNDKTGGLFRIAIKLMIACSTSDFKHDLIPIVNLIGVIFQIRDDYSNLSSSDYAANKGYCEDITEGKFSFPIVHAIRSDESNRRLINILRQRPKEKELKLWALTYMEEHTKSFDYTKGVIETLLAQANDEVDRLGGNEALKSILKKFIV